VWEGVLVGRGGPRGSDARESEGGGGGGGEHGSELAQPGGEGFPFFFSSNSFFLLFKSIFMHIYSFKIFSRCQK
jgi:hypothetical protein